MTYLEAYDITIKLHDIARLIERDIGFGTMSADVRRVADRLSDYVVQRKLEMYAEQISGPNPTH